MTDEAQDWAEYLAWTSHATPREYELTERLAWKRLQEALISRRSGAAAIILNFDAGTAEWEAIPKDGEINFEPAEGFPGDFAPEE